MKLVFKLFRVVVILVVILYFLFIYSLSNKILVTGSSHELTKQRFVEYWDSTIDDFLALVPEPESYTIKGYEGIDINLRYFDRNPDDPCVIIMSHGWSQDWAGMLKFAPALDSCSCDYVLYDMRAHGASGGDYPTGGIKEAEDLLKVTEWANQEKGFPKDKIGWVGSSWGAGASILAAADPSNVAFLIVDAPFKDWSTAIFERAELEYGSWIGLIAGQVMSLAGWRAGVYHEEASAAKNMAKVAEPVMLIHSQTDTETNSQQSVILSKKLMNDKSVFHHLDWGGDHSRDVYYNKEKYQVLVNDFLNSVDSSFVKKD